MSLFSVFTRLLVLIVSVDASSEVVRRTGVEASGRIRSSRAISGAWSQAVVKSRSKPGLSFWRSLRKELEAKRTDLLSSDVRESSTAARRDLLWQAVRQVDDQSHHKAICKLAEETTYEKEEVSILENSISHSKTKSKIASARECALMCAADSLDDRSHDTRACKSFTYNKTAHECKLFKRAQQRQGIWNKDKCCTSGPPCDLDSMREEIQSYFHAELERMLISQRRLANQLETESMHLTDTWLSMHGTKQRKSASAELVQKVATQVTKYAVPNVEQNVATHAERTMSKVNQKVTTHAATAAPKFVKKVAAQAERALPKVERKVEQKVSTLAEHAAPKFETNVAKQPERAVLKVEQKVATAAGHGAKTSEKLVATHSERAIPKVEQKVATPAQHGVPERATPNVEQKVVKPAAHVVPRFEKEKVATHVERVMPKVEQTIATPTEHVLPKLENKAATQPERAVPKVVTPAGRTVTKTKKLAAAHAKRAMPKVEQKVLTQVYHAAAKLENKAMKLAGTAAWAAAWAAAGGGLAEHAVPNVDGKVATQPERVVLKAVQTDVTHSEHAAPKVAKNIARRVAKQNTSQAEEKDAKRSERAATNVEQKHATPVEHALPNIEKKVARRVSKHTAVPYVVDAQKNSVGSQNVATEPLVPSSEQRVAVWTHWRLLIVFVCVPILVVVAALRLQSLFSSVKRLDASALSSSRDD